MNKLSNFDPSPISVWDISLSLVILQATWQLWLGTVRETITQSQLIGLFVTVQFIINNTINNLFSHKTKNCEIFAKIKKKFSTFINWYEYLLPLKYLLQNQKDFLKTFKFIKFF